MRILAICFLCTLSFSVFSAGKVDNSKVKNVRVDRNGNGMVAFEKAITGESPSCIHEAYPNHFSFDTNTEGGKAIYSMVLSAMATGKSITAYGTGTCSEYVSHVESWSYGVVFDN